MRKLMLSVLAPFVLLVAPLAAQQQPETMRVNADRVNLRVAPFIDSSIVRSLAKGTSVTVLSREGNWVRVQLQTQNVTGWVRANLLDAIASPATASQPAAPPPPPPPAGAPAAAPTPPTSDAQPAQAQQLAGAPAVRVPGATPAASARAASPSVQIELFGGYSTSQTVLSGTSSGSEANGSGPTGGFGIVIPVAASVGLELEGRYTQLSQSVPIGPSDSYHYHNNVAEGALFIRPGFGTSGTKIFLLAGPEFRYDVSCSITLDDGSPANSDGCTVDPNGRTDYGLTVGGGARIGPLSLQVQYNIGLRSVTDGFGETAKTRTLLFAGGIVF